MTFTHTKCLAADENLRLYEWNLGAEMFTRVKRVRSEMITGIEPESGYIWKKIIE
jgi:hypothetical protein